VTIRNIAAAASSIIVCGNSGIVGEGAGFWEEVGVVVGACVGVAVGAIVGLGVGEGVAVGVGVGVGV
jgi:hypothetical protein